MSWIRRLIQYGPTNFEAMLMVSFGVPALGLIVYTLIYLFVKSLDA